MNINAAGIYLSLKYIAPRKRKPINWGCADITIHGCLNKARLWLLEHGGTFVSGRAMACSFYDVPNANNRGETVRMQSVPIFAPTTELDSGQVSFINSIPA